MENEEGHEVSGHLGPSNSTIDDKGRIALGEDRAQFLEGGHVLVRGDLGCLEIYPIEAWKARVSEFDKCPERIRGKQIYRTLVIGTADRTVKMDEDGRLVVPMALREKCRLPRPTKEKDSKESRDIVFITTGVCIQVWSKEEHLKFEDDPYGYDQKRALDIQRAYDEMSPFLDKEAITK
jgi:DNA-binding transcriptional regulator/RsmH inhibitor MraZ